METTGRELTPEELAEHLQAFELMEDLEFEEVYDEYSSSGD